MSTGIKKTTGTGKVTTSAGASKETGSGCFSTGAGYH